MGETKMTGKNLPGALTTVAVLGALLAGTIGIGHAATSASPLADQVHQLQLRIGKLEARVNHIQLIPGPQGPKGDPGADAPAVLPSGQSESGDLGMGFQAQAAGELRGVTVSFHTPLASAPSAVAFGPTGACPGAGQASPGVLCIYGAWTALAQDATTYAMAPSSAGSADSLGFYLRVTSSGPGYVWWLGSYTYQAP
jgi:hypothetical protein